MPTYQLAFRDPPENLIERLKPVLVSQGNPPLNVWPADGGGVEFSGPGGEFLLRARAADALSTVWPDWPGSVVERAL